MRKLAIVGAVLAAALSFTAVAYAVNVYKVTPVGTTPGGKGTPSKPKPKKVKFGFTAVDSSGKAASPVKKYSIQFEGLKSYASHFPKCTFSQANGSKHKSACKAAKVGGGYINNSFGPAGSPTPGKCPVKLTLYNLGYGLALRVDGSPTTRVPGLSGTCPITVAQAIRATFTSKSVGGTSGSALTFSPQQNIRHPSGLSNAVATTVTSITSKTTKVKIHGKTRRVSLLSSVGCSGSTRTISVEFTDEQGNKVPASATTKC